MEQSCQLVIFSHIYIITQETTTINASLYFYQSTNRDICCTNSYNRWGITRQHPQPRGYTSTIIPHSHHPYLIHTIRHRDIQTSFTHPYLIHTTQTSFIQLSKHTSLQGPGGENSRRRGRQTAATTLTKDIDEKREQGVCWTLRAQDVTPLSI